MHIKDVPTTSNNPAANALYERMHQTVGKILRTYVIKTQELQYKPETL